MTIQFCSQRRSYSQTLTDSYYPSSNGFLFWCSNERQIEKTNLTSFLHQSTVVCWSIRLVSSGWSFSHDWDGYFMITSISSDFIWYQVKLCYVESDCFMIDHRELVNKFDFPFKTNVKYLIRHLEVIYMLTPTAPCSRELVNHACKLLSRSFGEWFTPIQSTF